MKKKSALVKPRLRYEWMVTYFVTGDVRMEWFATRAKAAARAEEIDVLNVFVSQVMLQGPDASN